jgi:hypothetical protein
MRPSKGANTSPTCTRSRRHHSWNRFNDSSILLWLRSSEWKLPRNRRWTDTLWISSVSNKQPSATASLVTKTKTSWFLPAHLLSLCLDPADFVLYSRRIRLKVLSLSKGPPNMDHLNISSSSLIHTLSCTFANMVRKRVTK